MIDIFNLTDNSSNTQVFYSSSSGYTKWSTWQKPNNAKMVYIFVLGGGAGGGGGRTGGSNTGTGGGGGASGGISYGLFPSCMLPDVLYISVGKGGAGGVANTAGVAGEITYVSVAPNSGSTAVLMQSSDVVAGGGGAGGSSVAGTAGSISSAWVYTNNIWPQLGQITAIGGQAGTAGGPTTSFGVSLTVAFPVTGGAGGGGESSSASSYSGGTINSTLYNFTRVTGGTNNVTAIINGTCGYYYNLPTNNSSSRYPMFFTGGAGGGAAHSTSTNGGNGGDGSFGCGGGGGGAAYNGTGGTGGDGGGGLVIISYW